MKTIISEQQIHAGVKRIGKEIGDHYGTGGLTIIGILTGSIVFLADLIRQLNMPLRTGVIQARSYRGTTQSGPLNIDLDLLPEIAGHDVLLVDDIFDTGHTLTGTIDQMNRLNAKSIRTAVLLRKKNRSEVAIEPDHVGFDIPDQFVVGYGLDHQDAHRNLPYVAALDPDEISPAMNHETQREPVDHVD